MRTLVGALVVAIGVLLGIYGLDATECLSTRISKIFHNAPGTQSIYFLVSGVLLVLLGMTLSYGRRNHTNHKT